MIAACIHPVADGTVVRVRVRPGASRTAVLGRTVLADGAAAVLAAISAPPEDGKANAALIQLLAKTWRVPKTSIAVSSGAAARTKMLHVAGVPALAAQLEAWFDSLPEG
jgi:uncharacterized protein (TIGR00251 family)